MPPRRRPWRLLKLKDMIKIHYRQLTTGDHDEYKRVRLDCLKQAPFYFGSTYEEGLHAKTLKLTAAINRPDKYNFAFGVFAQNERLVGTCGFITDMRTKGFHRGEMVQLFVDEAYKGKGIGKKLMNLTIDCAFANGETELIVISVATDNKKAMQLYRKVGFKEYGKLEKFFKWRNKYCSQSFLYLTKENYIF